MSNYDLKFFKEQEKLLIQQKQACMKSLSTLKEQFAELDEQEYNVKQAIAFLETYEVKKK